MTISVLVSNQSIHAAKAKASRILDSWLLRLSSESWHGQVSAEGLNSLIDELAALRSRNLHLQVFKQTPLGFKVVRSIGKPTNFFEGRVSAGLVRKDARGKAE